MKARMLDNVYWEVRKELWARPGNIVEVRRTFEGDLYPYSFHNGDAYGPWLLRADEVEIIQEVNGL